MCQIAPDDPLIENTAAAWDDVSDWIRGRVWIRRGRAHELYDFEAGQMTLTLDNSDRKFDWIIHSQYRPMNKIRLAIVTYDTVTTFTSTYWRFTGYVESYRTRFESGTLAFTDLRCVDASKYFSLMAVDISLAPQERSHLRIERILDYFTGAFQLWPDGDRTLPIDSEVDIQQMQIDSSALQHMQNVARTEGGQFLMSRAGNVVYEPRTHRTTTVDYLFNNAASGGDPRDVRYSDLVLSLDDSAIYNRIEVQRDGGQAVLYELDDTSMHDYFFRRYSQRGLLHATGPAASEHAALLLQRYKQPDTRIERITIDPAIDDQWSNVMNIDISDTIQVTRHSLADESPAVVKGFVEGIEEEIGAESGRAGPRSYRMTLTCSPAFVPGGATVVGAFKSIWTAATLSPGWTNLSVTNPEYAPAGYWRDAQRRVYVRGNVSGGSGIIFTLPVGFRPPFDYSQPVRDGSLSGGIVTVTQSGNVTLNSGNNANIDLSSIRFRNH